MPKPVDQFRLWLRIIKLIIILQIFNFLSVAFARDPAPEPILIGLDAEFSHPTSTVPRAIQRGIELAIDEINQSGGVLGGRPLRLITRDNRLVPARGAANIEEFATIPNLVAIFGSKFSPVAQEQIPPVHRHQIPFLLPWSAADDIVDNGNQPNYAFRLSLNDSLAMQAMLRHARESGITRVGVILPNTGWGRSSKKAIERFVAESRDMQIVSEVWYNWGDLDFKGKYDANLRAKAQVLILVSAENEGSSLVKTVAAYPPSERLPILSHWGVTGGDFFVMAGAALKKVDFAVVQTFTFVGNENSAARRILDALKTKYRVKDARKIEASVGLAHAYDLTRLLALAIERAGSPDRKRIRDALENIPSFDSLVGAMQPPFTPDRHEALSLENVFLARYATDGSIERLSASTTNKQVSSKKP